MKSINQAQARLMANFCADIAKGALLSGLGFTYALSEPISVKLIFGLTGILFAILALYFALRFAKILEKQSYE
jgi:hypothetical protein